MNKELIAVLSGPSGAGKSTLTKMLLSENNKIKLSISATTRNKREGEIDGVDYHFISKELFEQKIENDEFIEYAQVYDNYYGTLKSEIYDNWNRGFIPLLDIDWQGMELVSKIFSDEKLIKIFISPPSLEALEERLISRGKDSLEIIKRRMNEAKDHLKHSEKYKYVIINDDLNESFISLSEIFNNL